VKLSRITLVLVVLVVFDALLIVSGVMSALATLLTIGIVGFGIFQLSRMILRKSHVIWRLRNRLMVTYLFIGAVPIVLILALAYCGAWIVVGQVATYLVGSELQRRAAVLENPARFLSRSKPVERPEMVRQLAPLMRDREPGLQILVTGDQTFRYPENNNVDAPPDGWRDFTGIVYKGGRFYCMSFVRGTAAQALVLVPLAPDLLANLVPGIGALNLSNHSAPGSSLNGRLAGSVPPAYNAFDSEFIWYNPVEVAEWSHPNTRENAELAVITRPSAVLAVVFGGSVEFAQITLVAFVVIAALLAVVELFSVLIGVTMTRTITGAVHNLYEGTLRIGRGDFSHRIPVKGNDQLAALGTSFNQMSRQLEGLMAVAREKERLQSELTIASEVQNQLFPRRAPPTKTIQLLGACEPARSVSGDYYDYLCLPNGSLAFAIGDVAGKGISAALLMASIQSIMRTQLAAGVPMAATVGTGVGRPVSHFSTASVVAQLNRQLYENTSPEKYATFFFGLYDENSRILTYTNAGHLPPLLVCGGNVQPLEVTGTVVGMFPAVGYEEKTIFFHPEDMLIAYTDGITEPENAYGEEFGTDRLAECVLRNQNREPGEIVAKVMESVKQWSGAPELPDDMTVLIAKGLA
jgi:sigma-B regulation protein RsbU (phosphoserine phosphatase)